MKTAGKILLYIAAGLALARLALFVAEKLEQRRRSWYITTNIDR